MPRVSSVYLILLRRCGGSSGNSSISESTTSRAAQAHGYSPWVTPGLGAEGGRRPTRTLLIQRGHQNHRNSSNLLRKCEFVSPDAGVFWVSCGLAVLYSLKG